MTQHRKTIEMPQHAHIFKVNCCLKVQNAHSIAIFDINVNLKASITL